MYEEYFGFSKKPFSIVPDPHYFFLSAGHAEALAHLSYGINNEGGFVLLTGDVGTGKTTACRRLLEMLPEGAEVAFILNRNCRWWNCCSPSAGSSGSARPRDRPRTRHGLRHPRLSPGRSWPGRRAILILEEAQNLKPELLEQIRL